jgi:hypothetical protein
MEFIRRYFFEGSSLEENSPEENLSGEDSNESQKEKIFSSDQKEKEYSLSSKSIFCSSINTEKFKNQKRMIIVVFQQMKSLMMNKKKTINPHNQIIKKLN